MPRALLAAIAVAAQAASGSAAQCALILGHDLYGNDLLGPAGKPLPLPVSGPAECCDKCSTKAVGAEPKGRCAAWSYNHGTSTCWMKTGHGNKTGCQPNELCPNGDTSGVVLSATPIDPAADLQQKINAAIASGAATLNVAAGDYFFGNRTLLIQDATNFELRAAARHGVVHQHGRRRPAATLLQRQHLGPHPEPAAARRPLAAALVAGHRHQGWPEEHIRVHPRRRFG